MNKNEADEREVQKLRDEMLRPLAEKLGFSIGRRTTAVGMPTVLCLGNHSSGKSTFINYLTGESIQDTGVAPTDDGFTIVTYGEESETIDGRAVVIDPNLPYVDLQQFGKEFFDRLRLKRRPLPALRQLCLIDSPGLIDQAGTSTDRSRGYDFTRAVRWFAETADLVVFFFDPDKPGTTGESLRVFTDSLSDVHYKLLIVFNKVDTFTDIRDFARTYGSLCWNLSRVIRTKDMPHIYCTFVPDKSQPTENSIELAAFRESSEDLSNQIQNVERRRKSNLVGSLLDTAKQLHMHGRVVSAVGRRLFHLKLSLELVGAILLIAGAALAWFYAAKAVVLTVAIVLMVLGVALFFATRLFVRKRLDQLIGRIDEIYRDEFSRELLTENDSQFHANLWDQVKPKVVYFLREAGPKNIPYSLGVNRKIRRLDQAIDTDIPDLLSD